MFLYKHACTMDMPASLTIPIETKTRRKNEECATIKSKIVTQKLMMIMVHVLDIAT